MKRVRKGISEKVLLSLEQSPKTNKELCMDIFNIPFYLIEQNHRSAINEALSRLKEGLYVKKTDKWELDKENNGEYIIKILKNKKC